MTLTSEDETTAIQHTPGETIGLLKIRRLKISFHVLVLMAIGALPVVAQQGTSNDLVISLDRSACFGWCPVYSLTITGDGGFTIIPKKESAPGEPIIGRITPEEVNKLVAEFRKIKFYSLHRRYGSAEKSKGPGCPHSWTDSSTAEIGLSEKGKHKTVSHYLGCEGTSILNDLKALEDKIDEAVNTKKWASRLRSGVADVIELHLEINPARSTKPTNPR